MLKKHRKSILKYSSILLISIILISYMKYINACLSLADDNLFEETVENVIQTHVGAEIDLTPDSQE